MDVFHSDCIEYLKRCPDDEFNLIIADPPYFQICGEFDYQWTTVDDYLRWCKTWLTECCRVLKTTGSIYIWGAIGYNRGYALMKLADWFESNNMLTVRNWITQRNSRGRGTKKGFMPAREELVRCTKSDTYVWHVAYTDELSHRTDAGFDGKPRKNAFKRCSDVWIDIAEASQSSKERFRLSDGSTFPTVKPMKCCNRIILASSDPGDLVFIPFGGSGTEAIACFENQRRFVICEQNERYLEEVMLPRFRSNNMDVEVKSLAKIVEGVGCERLFFAKDLQTSIGNVR
jgi:site-specific DNA-methyltransferase (adenine-specific)